MDSEEIIPHILNVEHQYQTIPSQTPHPHMTQVVRNVQSLRNHQNQQLCGLWGNYLLPPTKTHSSVPDGGGDSSHEGSSLPSSIQGQNSTTAL